MIEKLFNPTYQSDKINFRIANPFYDADRIHQHVSCTYKSCKVFIQNEYNSNFLIYVNGKISLVRGVNPWRKRTRGLIRITICRYIINGCFYHIFLSKMGKNENFQWINIDEKRFYVRKKDIFLIFLTALKDECQKIIQNQKNIIFNPETWDFKPDMKVKNKEEEYFISLMVTFVHTWSERNIWWKPSLFYR